MWSPLITTMNNTVDNLINHEQTALYAGIQWLKLMATVNVTWSTKRAQILAVSTIITTTGLDYVKIGRTLMMVHLDQGTRFNIHA